MTPEENAGQVKYYALEAGVVIDRKDPRGLHRIRARIPGLIDKTAWAFPLTNGGGSPQRGGHIVPALGADVAIQFIGGDVEFPVYQAAWWGERLDTGSEAPKTIKEASAEEAADIQELQLFDGRLIITADERPRANGKGQLLVIEDTKSGDNITFDLARNGIRIKASYAIQLVCDGQISIDALTVQINGRTVRPTKAPI